MPQNIVTTEQGCLRGGIRITFKGQKFLSFLGIPYAKPPTGELRFKGPEPPEPWTGIRDATQPITTCLGPSFEMDPEQGRVLVVGGSEDCLVLNVYTHKLLSQENDVLKPVMVFFHGGAFTLGSSAPEIVGPEILMTEDIVLVTLNYRLGALGFLDLFDVEIGNAGLKDMVMALKWIQKNIKRFGGNPECVTIFGMSSGGAAVHYLVLSRSGNGLFHRAIAQSGCALNCWARGQRNNGFKLAKALGYLDEDPHKVLEFLQAQTPEDIFNAQTQLGDHFNPSIPRYFAPTIEKESKNAFITEEPIKIIYSGQFNHVPFILGYTSIEGLIMSYAEGLGMKISYTHFLPFFLGLDVNCNRYDEVNKIIVKHYFGTEVTDPRNLISFALVATDAFFLRGINQAVKGHAKNSTRPVYYYKMTMETKMNLKYRVRNILEYPGASHGDDLTYLFQTIPPINIIQGSPEERGVHCFVKLWTNFAKTGDPTCELDNIVDTSWIPATKNDLYYLEIGNMLENGKNPDYERMALWDEIFKTCPDPY